MNAPAEGRPTAWRRLLPLALLLVAHGILAVVVIQRGWVPHDEGLLGQTAERVLRGEVPHVDFQDTYTGGLAMWNALAFRLLGIGSFSMRLAMVPFYLGFVAAIFGLARRTTGPWAAAGVATLAGLLTIPNYAATMPSWYTLFFAGMGTWALAEAIRTEGRGWALAAGLAGGLGFLFKITALYWLGAGVLALLLPRTEPPPGRWVATRLLVAGSVALGVGAGLVLATTARPPVAATVHYGLPLAALGLALVVVEVQRGGGPLSARAREVGALLLPFGLGALLPVVAFALPYGLSGNLGHLWEGLFVTPRSRLVDVVFPLPAPWTAWAGLPLLGLLGVGLVRRPRLGRGFVVALALSLATLLALSWSRDVYRWVFIGMRHAFPVVGLVGAWVLAREVRDPRPRAVLALVLLAALFSSLIQVPFAGPLYFLHAAPMAVLAWTLVVAHQAAAPRRAHGLLLLFFLGYGAFRMLPTPFDVLRYVERPGPEVPLGLARSNLRVPESDARIYQSVVAAVQAHSAEGAAILALPDCPEVYFLSGRTNPTPFMYELFAEAGALDFRRVEALVEGEDVRVLVINEYQLFSRPMPPEYRQRLEARFPAAQVVEGPLAGGGTGPRFTVRWR